jgi:nitrite reductase/ring-hydroxylating ferredoxin subunit
LLLPDAWYRDPDAFVAERRALFLDAWQLIARKEAFSEPGDYVCQSLAGFAAFVVMSESGIVGAYPNVCRHQRLPVLDAGAGRAALLRCRYHGWTYRFDGSFKEAPPKYAPRDAASLDNNLRHLSLADWRGHLFVTQDDCAPSLTEAMVPFDGTLGDGQFALAAEVATDFQCNWKTLAEHWLANRAPTVWQFPALALEVSAGTYALHQLIPRTHERTRVVSHVLAVDAAQGAGFAEAAKTALASDKASCETGQTATTSEPGSALADFRARIEAVHRQIEVDPS